MVQHFKFLGLHISNNLIWTVNTTTAVLLFCSAIKSILVYGITAWYAGHSAKGWILCREQLQQQQCNDTDFEFLFFLCGCNQDHHLQLYLMWRLTSIFSTKFHNSFTQACYDVLLNVCRVFLHGWLLFALPPSWGANAITFFFLLHFCFHACFATAVCAQICAFVQKHACLCMGMLTQIPGQWKSREHEASIHSLYIVSVKKKNIPHYGFLSRSKKKCFKLHTFQAPLVVAWMECWIPSWMGSSNKFNKLSTRYNAPHNSLVSK